METGQRRRHCQISIHALREEGDLKQKQWSCRPKYFNPRPPRGGRRVQVFFCSVFTAISIHALREEGDSTCRIGLSGITDFNPRPPRGGRLATATAQAAEDKFQSTPSARRATGMLTGSAAFKGISIHALREEGDCSSCEVFICAVQISIHALREEGDCYGCRLASARLISIHALREEGDLFLLRSGTSAVDFNPRPPRGGRPSRSQLPAGTFEFQSTPSARRATLSGLLLLFLP